MEAQNMSTTMVTKETVTRKWYVLDAAGKPMGKTAAHCKLLSRQFENVRFYR